MFRIRFIALLGALLVTGSCRAADWPEFLGPAHDNVSTETGLAVSLPVPVLWDRKTGSGYGAPSVRGDLLVFHHRISDEEIVEACDATTGETRWKHAYPSHYIDPFGYNNGPRCAPLLTANRCYTFGAEGVLLCLELKTGKEIWRRNTAEDFQIPEAFFGVGSTPILEDGLLVAMIGGQPNSGVAAFDAETGRTVWESVGEKNWDGVPMTGWPGERLVKWSRYDPAYEKQASYCSPVAATIHGQRQVLVCTRQGLVSLNPKDGSVNFSFWFRSRQDSTVNAMTPVVSGDEILLSSAYYKTGSVLLQVLPDGRSVKEVWRGLQLEMHWSSPLLIGGFLYAFSGRNEPDARFRCVEFATGALKWDRPEGWPNGGHAKLSEGEAPPNVFGRGSGILADGKMIVLGEAGLLGLFTPDPAKVQEIARWQVPGLTYPCWAGPVLANRRLYLRSEDRLVCLDFAKR